MILKDEVVGPKERVCRFSPRSGGRVNMCPTRWPAVLRMSRRVKGGIHEAG